MQYSPVSMRVPTQLHPPADVLDVGDGGLARGGRLHLLGELGKGSSSTVHRALLESPSGLRRLVAVKMFGCVGSDDLEPVLAHAARTAQRAACVVHPNVVQVHDFGQWRRRPYFVTELVEGVDLATLLERYAARSLRLPLDLALFVACEVAEALSGARTARDHHGVQLGMRHLALGTRKVLLGWRGEVKVFDFETSVTAEATSCIRNVRAVRHRTAALAPEVARGREGDSRSDVFSLGLVMRELLVGPRFASGVSSADVVRLAREGFVQPMSFQPRLPEALMKVMDRALAVAPADRYPNASALAFELSRLALGMGVGDGRLFLRRTLDRELGNNASEVTAERAYDTARRSETVRPPKPKPQPVRPEDLHELVVATGAAPAFIGARTADVADGIDVLDVVDVLDDDEDDDETSRHEVTTDRADDEGSS